MRALDLHRASGDAVRFAEVALDTLRTPAPRARLSAIREEALHAEGVLLVELVARLLVAIPEQLGEQDAAKARQILRHHPLPDVEASLLGFDSFKALMNDQLSLAEDLMRQGTDLRRGAGFATGALGALMRRTQITLYVGELDRAIALSHELLREADLLRNRQHAGFAHQHLAGIHFMRGEYPAYEEHLAAIPSENFFSDLYPAIRAEIGGDLQRAVQLLPPREKAAGVRGFMGLVLGHRARVFMHAGLLEQASAELEALREVIHTPLTQPARENPDFICARQALRLASPAFSQEAYESLRQPQSSRFDVYGMTGVDSVRGDLALQLDLVDAAEQHFRSGLEWSERERCHVEAGRNLQGLADVAQRRGDHALAMQHLDTAGELFAKHGAKLYLDQVLAKKEFLKA